MKKIREKLKGIEPFVLQHIKGQDDVVKKYCQLITRTELCRPEGYCPKSIALFLGTTGVGKTELPLKVAEYLYQESSESRLFRFDMSEFMLIEKMGEFLDRIKSIMEVYEPTGGIILFDEIEKGHSRIQDLFLQMFEPGHVTVEGKKYLLKNFHIVITSNIGAEKLSGRQEIEFEIVEEAIKGSLPAHMRLEIINRIHEIIVFRRLEYQVQREIAKLHLDKKMNYLRTLGNDVSYSPEVLEFIIRNGIDPDKGARELKRQIERYVGNALAKYQIEKDVDTTTGVFKVGEDYKTLIL